MVKSSKKSKKKSSKNISKKIVTEEPISEELVIEENIINKKEKAKPLLLKSNTKKDLNLCKILLKANYFDDTIKQLIKIYTESDHIDLKALKTAGFSFITIN